MPIEYISNTSRLITVLALLFVKMADSTAADTSLCKPPPPEYSKQGTIHVVIAGKGAAGKSTLMKNLFNIEDIEGSMGAEAGTLKCYTKEKEKNGIKFISTDTAGLDVDAKRRDLLKKLSQHIQDINQGKTDLLLYCISVHAGSRFDSGNPAIMKSLHEAFGKDIWKRCVLVLTFSNNAWDKFAKKEPREEAVKLYKIHLEKYTVCFQQELNRLGVHDVTVKMSFTQPAQQPAGQTTIMAIPAGDEVDDTVFLEGEDSNYPWNDVFIIKLIQCSNDSKLNENLLQYRYGAAAVLAMLGGGAIGAVYGSVTGGAVGATLGNTVGGVGGVAVGVGIGAIIGALGGPVGAGVGAIVGEMVVSTVAGAVAGGVIFGEAGAALGGVVGGVVGAGAGAVEGAKKGAKVVKELVTPKPDTD